MLAQKRIGETSRDSYAALFCVYECMYILYIYKQYFYMLYNNLTMLHKQSLKKNIKCSLAITK